MMGATTFPVLKAKCHGNHDIGSKYYQLKHIKWWGGNDPHPGWYCSLCHPDWNAERLNALTFWNLDMSRQFIEVPPPHYGCDEFHIHLSDCNECSDHKAAGCAGCFAWTEFCREHDMSPMADATWSRRAWISGLSTYLRGANYLIYDEGGLVDIE